jgi:hypothetical protein
LPLVATEDGLLSIQQNCPEVTAAHFHDQDSECAHHYHAFDCLSPRPLFFGPDLNVPPSL